MKISFDYLYLFFQSSFLELPVYLYFYSKLKKDLFFWVTASNAITHPFFFFLIMGLPLSFLSNILIGEISITLIEAYIISKKLQIGFKECLFMSAHANLISWQLGPILTTWIT